MKQVHEGTAWELRCRGLFVPDVPDDTHIQMTVELDGDELRYTYEIMAKGYIERIDIPVHFAVKS